MRRKQIIALIILALLITNTSLAQLRVVAGLSDGWKFSRGKHENVFQVDFNDRGWQTVSVPQDWAIYGPFDKEIDKQVVAITQNNEKTASEKNRANRCPALYRRRLVPQTIQFAAVSKGTKGVTSF